MYIVANSRPPACDRPRNSNRDRVAHRNVQFSREPLGTTAKELVTGELERPTRDWFLAVVPGGSRLNCPFRWATQSRFELRGRSHAGGREFATIYTHTKTILSNSNQHIQIMQQLYNYYHSCLQSGYLDKSCEAAYQKKLQLTIQISSI